MIKKYKSQDPIVKLETRMKLNGLSKKTQKAYLYYIEKCILLSQKSPRSIQTSDVETYLNSLLELGRSASTLNIAYSALKYYFDGVLKRHFFVSIPRVKKSKKLPTVLSKREVFGMIRETKNVKHRTVIELLYGTGMRVGELVRVKMSDFDFERGVVHIKRSKGAKDRIVSIPQTLWGLLLLQKDLKSVNDFLFTNYSNLRMSEASIQKIVSKAAKSAGIDKKVSAHTLRHTFATHLLESGTNIRYIQSLLGHASIRTTQVYTKVSLGVVSNITSPLDGRV